MHPPAGHRPILRYVTGRHAAGPTGCSDSISRHGAGVAPGTRLSRAGEGGGHHRYITGTSRLDVLANWHCRADASSQVDHAVGIAGNDNIGCASPRQHLAVLRGITLQDGIAWLKPRLAIGREVWRRIRLTGVLRGNPAIRRVFLFQDADGVRGGCITRASRDSSSRPAVRGNEQHRRLEPVR
jgi:hypothetical protein